MALSKHARDIAIGMLLGLAACAGIALLLYLLAGPAHAAPVAGDITLTLTQTTRADGKVDVRLSWNTAPRADGCVSTGGWTGSRNVSRSSSDPLVISAVAPPKEYTLTCRWDDRDVVLTWQSPTHNIDGTAVKLPLGYRIYYGNTEQALSTIVDVPPAKPVTARRVIDNLAAGVYYFAMTTLNVDGESERSAVIQATLGSATAAATQIATAIAAKPNPPTGFAVSVEDD